MSENLTDSQWETLLQKISDGQCTPILGSEAAALPQLSAAAIAARWAHEFGYPWQVPCDLTRVAQFVSVTKTNPKELLQALLRGVPDDDTAYRLLRELPLPIFITTTYDDRLSMALVRTGKQPRRTLWPWNNDMLLNRKAIQQRGFWLGIEGSDDPQRPVVLHLYGHYQIPESLVLTEDDYLDFLVSIATEQRIYGSGDDKQRLPPRIQEALAGTSLVFIGYHLDEWSFRILLRAISAAITGEMKRFNITVQVPPDEVPPNQRGRVQEFLSKYFEGKKGSTIFWGQATEFITELYERWQKFQVRQPSTTFSAPLATPVVLPPATRLRDLIVASFNAEELRMLCDDLEINPDDIPGETLSSRAAELIAYCERHGKFEALKVVLRMRRSETKWSFAS